MNARPHPWIFTVMLVLVGLSIAASGSVAAQSTGQVDINVGDLAGTGTADDPYIITNASELQAMEDDLTAEYILANDIDANITSSWNTAKGFDPVGTDFNNRFQGKLNGNGHSIIGLTINRQEPHVGLFGVIGSDGMVTDIEFQHPNITSGQHTGSVAGYNYGGSIQNTSVSAGKITGNSSVRTSVGGIAGVNDRSSSTGVIDNVSVNANINGIINIGGLVGTNEGIITNSKSYATVTGNRSVGGIAGENPFGVISEVFSDGNTNGVAEIGGVAGSNSRIIINSSTNASVSGRQRVGGFVGDNLGVIRNASAHGNVSPYTGNKSAISGINTDKGSQMGGLVGDNTGTANSAGIIIGSKSTADVNGTVSVGGLVGYHENGTISHASANGSVNGTKFVGGLVGANAYGRVQNTIASGPVSGSSSVGGLSGSNVGNISDSYWDTVATNQPTSSGGGTGLTTSQMKGQSAQNNMPGLSFGDTWILRSNDYPKFIELSKPEFVASQTPAFSYQPTAPTNGTAITVQSNTIPNQTIINYRWDFDDDGTPEAIGEQAGWTYDRPGTYTIDLIITNNKGYIDSTSRTVDVMVPVGGGFVDVRLKNLAGSGTPDDPYLITNISELQAMEDNLTAHYALGGDINASSTASWYNGAGFSPIGNASDGFSGSLDGDGHNITHLTINRGSTENVGIIGKADEGATIESINLHSAAVAGKNDVGSLVGELSGNSVVRNTNTSGVITGKNSTGGLVGVTEGNSTVIRSSANGTVSGLDKIGGLVGSNIGGVVTESSSHAAVTGQTNQSRRAGGLVGGNFNSAVINQSYATGSVDGARVGGITGENFDSSRVATTYATGSLNGTSGLTGGIVGENFKSCPFQSQSQLCSGFGSSTVSDSYWNTQTTGEPASAGNATGLTTAEMTGSNADTTMAGFDFQNIWTTRSNGYPVLKSKQSAGPGDVTGDGVVAKDPDNDGVYEDINGDGSADLRDLQPFFNLIRPSASPPSNPAFFDVNGDGSTDLRDLQPFFNEVKP